jgi:hypothetical protein
LLKVIGEGNLETHSLVEKNSKSEERVKVGVLSLSLSLSLPLPPSILLHFKIINYVTSAGFTERERERDS